MRDKLMSEAKKFSRVLSWKAPKTFYYSMKGVVVCPACSKDVNLRDLSRRKNGIFCKECK